ncbi:hypothetical protein F5Y09DRAFT_354734 [Xylaria sp. FL1042]|nr:hypothetical protein F5Y09DRAFT_354734 [Xylaria sp. FL1042]
MAELFSLADVPTIPSSMDPIHTGHSASLASAAQGILAILRRTKSECYRNSSQDRRNSASQEESEGENEYTRARTNSPVRANSKRRRAAAPTPGEISRRTSSSSLPSEPDSSARHVSPRRVSEPSTPNTTASDQRSPSRGRTRKRNATPHIDHSGQSRSRQHDERSNISRRRQYTHSERPQEQAVYSPPSSEADESIVDVASYVTKGGFRLRAGRELGEFRFPKPRTQPEPAWSAGDGFSDDEARPQFTSPMTRKWKRKRSRSLSSFGQLSLEADDTAKSTPTGTASAQLHLRGSRGRVSRVAKDSWPTRESFMEPSISKQPRNIAPGDYSVTKSTPSSHQTCSSISRPETKQVVSRKRQASDFENFGKRRRKSRSRHSRGPSSSFTKNHRAIGSQRSDEEYEEGKSGPYEGVGDEHTVNDLEASDTNSE